MAGQATPRYPSDMSTKLLLIASTLALSSFAFGQDSEEDHVESEARCPLCVAGGFGASSQTERNWNLSTLYVPRSVTEAETFLWYRADPRLQFGVAHLSKQNAVRFLLSANLIPEREKTPSVNIMLGTQETTTGNPGYAMTFEKRWSNLSTYVGVGFRRTDSQARLIGGARYSFAPQYSVGFQEDGLREHLFVTHDRGDVFGGLYLYDMELPGILFGIRF